MCSVIFDSFQLYGLPRLQAFHPWNVPSKNIAVSCYFLLQGIFPTEGTKRVSPASLALQADF